MSIKRLLGASVFAASLFVLAACGGEDTADSVTLYVSGDSSEGNAYAQMAEKYEEETGVHVEVTDVPYADLQTKITSAVQADDAPDVARTSGVNPDWAEYLMDLSDIAESANTLDSMTVRNEEGVVQAIPTDLTAVGMFLNKDLFEEAGVDYPTSEEDIWTWDEFLDSVNEVKENTDARFGFVMDSSDHRLRAMIYQFGGQDFFLNEEGTSYETDEKSLEAVELFKELNENGTLPKSVWTANEDASAMFKSGQIPVYMSGSWQIKDFSENIPFDWQAVYMPYDEHRATNLGGNFMVGFENGANPEGGREFIEWLYQPENYTQLAIYAGYMPALEGIEVEYEGGEVAEEAYEIFYNEIEASDDIAGKQTAEGLEMSLKGLSGHGGSTYADFIRQYLNDEIDLETVTENHIENLNRDRLEQ
ncbi:MAG TPA: sugar ABC transporter substrate-binding protein [Atopostipes sp.]|nr:sugar ABC transporter substrate-binding protein [Atopostipes sp.]